VPPAHYSSSSGRVDGGRRNDTSSSLLLPFSPSLGRALRTHSGGRRQSLCAGESEGVSPTRRLQNPARTPESQLAGLRTPSTSRGCWQTPDPPTAVCGDHDRAHTTGKGGSAEPAENLSQFPSRERWLPSSPLARRHRNLYRQRLSRRRPARGTLLPTRVTVERPPR
jgi:hypothetical protein